MVKLVIIQLQMLFLYQCVLYFIPNSVMISLFGGPHHGGNVSDHEMAKAWA